MFGGHESFYECYSGYWARKLQKQKVPRFIKDFEGDSYKHILCHMLEVTVGTMTFFTCDVTNPPPDLLASQPAIYLSQVRSSGGLVAFKFTEYVGNPVLHWLRSGRTSDGDKADLLHALAFHMNRATTHKVNCVLIELLALMSTQCVDPEVAAIAKSMLSGSFTGKVGSLMFNDRLVEFLNYVQGLRDGKFAAFDRAIQYTSDIEAMIHVQQLWECATRGDSPLHDPVRQSLLNGARVVRDDLRSQLGTDLTVR